MKRLLVFLAAAALLSVYLAACAVPEANQPASQNAVPTAEDTAGTAAPTAEATQPAASQPDAPEATKLSPLGGPARENFGLSGQVFVDDMTLVAPQESGQPALLQVSGNLPTPCHKLDITVKEPDGEGNIEVLFLVTPPGPDQMCTQVLEPFAEEISLGDLQPGSYSVSINGEPFEELTIQ